jgi:uncharacterized delta-60 repeat protein
VTVDGFTGGEMIGIAARPDDELVGLASLRNSSTTLWATLRFDANGKLLQHAHTISGQPWAMIFANGRIYAVGQEIGKGWVLAIFDNTGAYQKSVVLPITNAQHIAASAGAVWVAGTYLDGQQRAGLAAIPFDAEGNPHAIRQPVHLTPTGLVAGVGAFAVAPDDTLLVAGSTDKSPPIFQAHRVSPAGADAHIESSLASFKGGMDAIVAGGVFYLTGLNENGDSVFARLAMDGSPDPSFASPGAVLAPVGQRAYQVALSRDGQLLAGVAPKAAVTPPALGVARLSTNGALDPSFGNGGLRLYTASTTNNMPVVRAMCVQSTGRIIIAGTDFSGGSTSSPIIVGFR